MAHEPALAGRSWDESGTGRQTGGLEIGGQPPSPAILRAGLPLVRRLAGLGVQPRMRQQAAAGAAGMGGRAAKQAPPDASPDASSGSSSGSGSREHAAESLGAEISERLTLSMQDARVICRRPSALNGDILVEELLDEPSGNVGTTVRRMRFCR